MIQLKKIGNMIKKSGQATIYNCSDAEGNWSGQWLSDGRGIYPVYGLPKLDKAMLLTMLDISAKDWEEYLVVIEDEPAFIELYDWSKSDENVAEYFTDLYIDSEAVLPIGTVDGGLLFVRRKYLDVIKAETEDGVELYIRKGNDGDRYVVVKEGMMVCGIVQPSNLLTLHMERKLEEMAGRAKTQIARQEGIK